MNKLAVVLFVVFASCQAGRLQAPRHTGSALPHERQEKLVNRVADEVQQLNERLPQLGEPTP